VTALYDFAGQGSGDLVFREGDRIRVTKKTGSTDDWWREKVYREAFRRIIVRLCNSGKGI
jgi:hypothetical protein